MNTEAAVFTNSVIQQHGFHKFEHSIFTIHFLGDPGTVKKDKSNNIAINSEIGQPIIALNSMSLKQTEEC